MSSATGATDVHRRLDWQVGTVTAKRRETPAACTLALDLPHWGGHLAGQHVDIRLTAEDGYQAQRSYSIASAPEQGALELTIERLADGEVSPYLVDDVREGDQLELRGPIGGWFTWQASDGGPLLLCAGGSGLVPLMAMLRHRAAAGAGTPTRLLVSTRGAEDLLYAGELEELMDRDDRLAIHPTFTRHPPPGWMGYARRVDRAMLGEVAFDPALRPRCYVCGPTAFAEAVAELLVALGHDPALVKTERFGASGGGP